MWYRYIPSLKAPSECSRASNLSSKSFKISSTSLRISMKRLRAREKLKLAQLEAAQLKEVIEKERKGYSKRRLAEN